MADNTTLNAGTGGDVIATDDVAGVKYQRVKLVDGTLDSTAVIPGDAANGLDVDVTRVQGTVTVSGTVTANAGTGTLTVADNQTLTDNAAFTDGTSKIFPVGLVFDEVAGTALTENDVAAPRIDAKRAQIGVIEDATTRGQRAAVTASNALKVDGSAVTQPVSGTVTANAGSGPFPVSDNAGSLTVDAPVGTPLFARLSDGTAALTTSGGRLSVDASGVAVPVTDNAGSLTVDAPVGTPVFVRLSDGASAIATLPVSLASLPALVTGSALVGRVNVEPQTANGLSTFHLVSAATTNATNIKASAGQVYGWYIYNSNAAARKVAFHNTSGTPTAGSGVVFSLVIPPSSAANVEFTMGLAFATGIGITTVTDLTDAGTTAVAANDLIINVFYK